MRELTSIALEMERQGKRLGGLLRVGRLNTMTRMEFRDLVATADRLMVNLADFNASHFGPSNGPSNSRRLKSAAQPSPARRPKPAGRSSGRDQNG